MDEFGKDFDGKRILITGGTGSLGRTLTTQLLKFNVRELTVMSRHEDLQVQMKREVKDPRVKYLIGDVRDLERCRTATRHIDIIFHTAALKHVSDAEGHPSEAIKTNLMGTINIKNAAIANNVASVIGISTDKAAKPVNVYGMTKALDEKVLLINENDTDTKFSVVRYGNVVGSRGSVVRYWYQLAKAGEILPITDLRMTRFWLTLEDATKLIFASTRNPGKLMVKKCKSFKLIDLAQIYEQKYGVKSQTVGTRPGEKIHEVLLTDLEMRKAELLGEHYIVDYTKPDISDTLEDFTSANAERATRDEMISILQKEGFYD